ncbi:MAG: hypothetical protein OER43_15660 [Gammaproteobacteria bacterium]|nr:hypothetical protein [Gammaproteobacteria bacterium]
MNLSRRRRVPRVAADATSKEAEVARLLSQHFGDGLVYMVEESDHEVLRHAMESGLISTDGHLTVAGYRTLKRSVRD